MFNQIQRIFSNLPGWHTSRKIVIIESDDWGSIRMPSLKVYEELRMLGVNVSSGDNERFNTLDTLASKNDFEALFGTLQKHKDQNGRHPVVTAMTLSANPDFEKIRQEHFANYFFEPMTTTFDRYKLGDVFSLWKQGESEGVFWFEFHGREHLNVNVWMNDLINRNKDTIEAFNRGFWGFRSKNKSMIPYQAAFDVETKTSLQLQKEIVKSGLQLFESLHGRRASCFVPPNGAINQELIDYSIGQGIKYVSTPKIQIEPVGEGATRKRYRYLGKEGKSGMLYLTRNCFFEPSYKGKGFSVSDCLRHIEIAFLFKKPAIISTHRVNYVGGLNRENRANGNNALNILLFEILKKWPAVEFMTSVELGDFIRDDKKQR